MTVGSRIAALRKEVGLSQSQVADLVNSSQATISRLEAGEREQEFGLIAEVARVLEGDVSELLPAEYKKRLAALPAGSSFIAFCPDPFCAVHKIEVLDESRVNVRWGHSSYPGEQFDQMNFCGECKRVLKKNCSGCEAPIHERSKKFCVHCGEATFPELTAAQREQILGPESEDDVPF